MSPISQSVSLHWAWKPYRVQTLWLICPIWKLQKNEVFWIHQTIRKNQQSVLFHQMPAFGPWCVFRLFAVKNLKNTSNYNCNSATTEATETKKSTDLDSFNVLKMFDVCLTKLKKEASPLLYCENKTIFWLIHPH